MEGNKRTIIVVISLLVVSFVACIIGYAAMNSKLKINGTTDFRTASWDLHFSDEWYVSTLGSPELCVDDACKINEDGSRVEVSSVAPSIGGTEILFPTLGLVFGDEVVYTFYVENSGTIDAYLYNSFKEQSISFIGSDADVNKVMVGFDYFVLINGISLEEILAVEDGVMNPYRILRGKAVDSDAPGRMRIDVVFSYRGTEFHKENVKIDGLKLKLVFNQYME